MNIKKKFQAQLQQKSRNKFILTIGILIIIVVAAFFYFPKNPTYQAMSEINNYGLAEIILKEPKISYTKNNEYFILEVSDIDCNSCASFHGFGSDEQSKFSKLFKDFIKSGKVDYLWINTSDNVSISKVNSMYCVAEQDSQKFFDYREKLVLNQTTKFDFNQAKEYIKDLYIDQAKFESCFNLGKYKNRIDELTKFASTLSPIEGESNLYLYRINNEQAKRLDGTTENKKFPFFLIGYLGNQDYEEVIKPGFGEKVKS